MDLRGLRTFRTLALSVPLVLVPTCVPKCSPDTQVYNPKYGMAVWDRIAQCESGGNWSYPPVTNRHGTFTGGLMIWEKAWDQYGGEEFSNSAYQTSKINQIQVAERIADDVGIDSAWQCYP
jgi:hypothetical protein